MAKTISISLSNTPMEPAHIPISNILTIQQNKRAMRPNKSDYHKFPFILPINIKKIMHRRLLYHT